MFMLVHIVSKDMKESSRYTYLGYPLIVLTAIVVILNLGVGLYETIKGIKESCKKKEAAKPGDKKSSTSKKVDRI